MKPFLISLFLLLAFGTASLDPAHAGVVLASEPETDTELMDMMAFIGPKPTPCVGMEGYSCVIDDTNHPWEYCFRETRRHICICSPTSTIKTPIWVCVPVPDTH